MADSELIEPPTPNSPRRRMGDESSPVPSVERAEAGLENTEPGLIQALGITDFEGDEKQRASSEEPEPVEEYEVVPDPNADAVDLSELRGVSSDDKKKADDGNSETELENLAELVPDVKVRRTSAQEGTGAMTAEQVEMPRDGDEAVEVAVEDKQSQSMKAQKSKDMDDSSKVVQAPPIEREREHKYEEHNYQAGTGDGQSSTSRPGQGGEDDETFDGYPDSDHALEDESEKNIPKEFMNMSSANSISTATQTHEVRMPMYLPTFKPATGCTNASDFIVRCFVARLRSGITVVKHGRSRWCKSRLRILHIHPDGRSLSWKPAEGEPTSSKRPPKLDLSTCLEVRHAWSPDPQNPMYTGTPILRQKCEAANAHKSFALIFKQRTVDITAVTADQCKVLMEGFSALCFRLQVANLAGRGGAKKGQAHRPMPEEDGVSTTASATLTNNSTPRAR